MSESSRRSRLETPWNDLPNRTPLQELIRRRYIGIYEDKHLPLLESDEAAAINSFRPWSCPYCDGEEFHLAGFTRNHIQRYRCNDCGKYFTPLTGTIFQDHKISLTEWVEYILNVVRYLSINADSWNNRNAFTTSRYWFEKLMIALEEDKNNTFLTGKVVMDETYYTVSADEIQRNAGGGKLHGISKNQMCIEVACSKTTTYCALLGLGKPSSQSVYMALKDHIEPGSILVHDMEKSHGLLVRELGLVSHAYKASDLKGLDDSQNPLRRVNEVHARLKNFLYSHNSFKRNKIQGVLDLFCFMSNPPINHLLKVEKLIKLGMNTGKTLKYRDFYNVSPK